MGSMPATAETPLKGRAASTLASTNDQRRAGYDSIVEGTARIVASFVATATLKREDLGAVVREVRAALA